MKLNGYKEANKIDDQINKLLEEHDINEDSVREWLKFTRTIKSSAEIIERAATRIATKKLMGE